MGIIIAIVITMVLVLALGPFIISWKAFYDAYRSTYAYDAYSNWDLLMMSFTDMLNSLFNN